MFYVCAYGASTCMCIGCRAYFNSLNGGTSVRIAGGLGGVNPLPHLADPLPQVKVRPRGGRGSTPHLSFAKVGMLIDSHFLLMQFLKYLQCDVLNVITILIHIED